MNPTQPVEIPLAPDAAFPGSPALTDVRVDANHTRMEKAAAAIENARKKRHALLQASR